MKNVCVITGGGSGMGFAAALFLATDDSRFVNGTVLTVE